MIKTSCVKKIYLASPFETEKEKEGMEKAKEILRGKGLEVYVPQEHKIPNAWDYPNTEWGLMVFAEDIAAIEAADIVVVLSRGRRATAGTSFEAGFAFGIGKKVVVVEMPGVELMSLMLANGRYATVKGLDGLQDYNFETMPETRTETEQK